MEITQTTQSTQSASSASTSEADGGTSALSSDFETFLRMLTVQMENQDPLNPIESADFAVQLATFSGVEQQVRSNDLLESLVGQNSLSALTQISGWVGMEARAAVAAPFDGQPVTVYPKMPQGADQATLIVRNEFGTVVSRSATPVSEDPISWDGTDQFGANLPHGDYSFEIEGKKEGDVIETLPAEVYAPVVEARLNGSEAVVVFAAGDESPSDEVTAVRQPQG
jgi:flagellar basal-body rod modification protein FlgD